MFEFDFENHAKLREGASVSAYPYSLFCYLPSKRKQSHNSQLSVKLDSLELKIGNEKHALKVKYHHVIFEILQMASKQNISKPSARAGNLLSVREDEQTPVQTVLKEEKKNISSPAYLGHLFEIKLLTLVLIRGTKQGQRFELTTNDESMGGKFDDLIFRYKVNTKGNKHWRYRYLQAKHRTNTKMERITTEHLIGNDNKDTAFSLQKYFHSYLKITGRGDDIHDCIICTTLNFDIDNLQNSGIELVTITEDEDILYFPKRPNKPSPTRYRLKIKGKLLRKKLLSSYHSDVKNRSKKIPRAITIKDVDDFFEKLTFFVSSPNADELSGILNDEVGNYYMARESCQQTIRIIEWMSNWFTKKDPNWLCNNDGKNILLAGIAEISDVYQNELEKDVRFNQTAIEVMAGNLRNFANHSSEKFVERIATSSPRLTAVKVISAIQTLINQNEGWYFVTSSKHLQSKEDQERWINILKIEKYSPHFFIVVCDNESEFDDSLLTNFTGQNKNKIVIISVRDVEAPGMKDEPTFEDLSSKSKSNILSKTVSFWKRHHCEISYQEKKSVYYRIHSS